MSQAGTKEVTPRPAATVIVARETAAGNAFEVLMVRRNDQVAFMAGAYVFPGGRVDEADRTGGESDALAPFRMAAVRELQEEAGLHVDPAELVPIAHWITPAIEKRRYDTRFFLTRMPDGQVARHDESETTELAWLTPAQALEQCTRGAIHLPPPTWTTLKGMRRHATIADLFAWSRSLRSIPAVQPHLEHQGECKLLTLPGDPTYPTIEGWEIPEDTRFVLADGRWQPARP